MEPRKPPISEVVILTSVLGALLVVLGLLSRVVCTALSEQLIDPGESRFLILPGDTFASFPGFFLALGLICLFYVYYHQRFGNDRDTSEAQKKDDWSGGKWLFRLGAILGFFYALFLVNTYTKFMDDRMIVNPFFWFFESERTYDDVNHIYRIHKTYAGKRIPNPYYVIEFKDGDRWKSTGIAVQRNTHPVQDQRLIEFVMSKSGVTTIEDVDTL